MDDNQLQTLRSEIDSIDAELIALLNRRYKAVESIGEYKRERHLPIYDPSRQRKLMERLEKLNQGPMTPEILHAVYREIMSGAQRLERPLKAAFLGPLGTFSHQATLDIFGQGAELVPELKIVSDFIFTKTKSNALTSEDFAAFIQTHGITEFFVAGADATACIKSTCYNMTKNGYTVHVLSDCITSYDKKKLPEMLAYYESKGCTVENLVEVM